MQTSRFQLGLIATLAVGLGFSLASSEAIGYPAGAAVSMGTNPVWSVGAGISSTTFVEVLTAPVDQDVVVTDLILTTENNGQDIVSLGLATGEIVGRIYVHGPGRLGGDGVSHTMTSGIKIPAGGELQIKTTYGSGIQYTFSGYYAQP